MKALGIAATGMAAQQTNVDVIANNIANANTTGFKSGRAAFQDLIYQSSAQEGTLTSTEGTLKPVGMNVGLGVHSTGLVRLTSQGGLIQTSNPLNVALEGDGFFVVNRPDGSSAYTRDGNFQLNAEGQMVTLDGFELEPGLVIPSDTREIAINQEGVVMAYLANDADPTELGQITLATFVNQAGLKPVGNNLLEQTGASGEPSSVLPGTDGVALIRQGYLENSNVNIIQQITDLISAQRAYEMNSKAIETADQMLSTANQIK